MENRLFHSFTAGNMQNYLSKWFYTVLRKTYSLEVPWFYNSSEDDEMWWLTRNICCVANRHQRALCCVVVWFGMQCEVWYLVWCDVSCESPGRVVAVLWCGGRQLTLLLLLLLVQPGSSQPVFQHFRPGHTSPPALLVVSVISRQWRNCESRVGSAVQ